MCIRASVDVVEFRQPPAGHSWRPECYFRGDGWGGIAANADHTLFAAANKNTVGIYDTKTARPHGAPGVIIRDVKCPRSMCFAKDMLLVADAGNNRIAEFTTTGVLVRSIAVWENSWLHGVAYSGAVIAASFIQALEVYLIDYVSCAVLHRVATSSPPVGVRFTRDGTHVVFVNYYTDPVITTCRVDTGGSVSCRALDGETVFVIDLLLRGDNDDDVVIATSYPFQDIDIAANHICVVKADGTQDRETVVHGRVTALARCGTDICYKLHGDDAVHVLPPEWSQSLRQAWIAVCTL